MKNTLHLFIQGLMALALTVLAVEGALLLAHLYTQPAAGLAAGGAQPAAYRSSRAELPLNPDGSLNVRLRGADQPLEVEIKEVDAWAFNQATVPVEIENSTVPVELEKISYSSLPVEVEVERWNAGVLEVEQY